MWQFFTALAYAVPIIVWIIWKKKVSASTFPLIVGFIAYIFISFARGIARLMTTNNMQGIPWLFYLCSALLSGIFEESGRYIVFRYCIPKYNRWTDCVSYGLGHISAETFLTHRPWESDIYDSMWEGYDFIWSIAFSIAMSVLIFAAVHYAESKILLFTAIGLHTAIDIMAVFELREKINFFEMMFLHPLFIVAMCYLAYRVFRHYYDTSSEY